MTTTTYEHHETLTIQALRALARAAALADETRSAVVRASTLVGRAVPLVTHPESKWGHVTDALRALSELELAGQSAQRLATDVSAAGARLASAAGCAPDVAARLMIEPPRPLEAEEGSDIVQGAVRATARTAALAEAGCASVDRAAAAVRRAATTAPPWGKARRMEVNEALDRVRAARRHADELVAGTASAGRNLAAAVGWMSELS